MRQAIASRKKKVAEAAKAVISVLSQKMRTPYNPNQSPRVIIIQKLYGKFFNKDDDVNIFKT